MEEQDIPKSDKVPSEPAAPVPDSGQTATQSRPHHTILWIFGVLVLAGLAMASWKAYVYYEQYRAIRAIMSST